MMGPQGRCILVAAWAAAAVVGGTACGAKQDKAQLAKDGEFDLRVDNKIGDFRKPTAQVNGVGIAAVAQPDGSVVLSVENMNESPLEVAPMKFGVIVGPRRGQDLVVLTPESADLRSFAPESLRRGGQGVFRFSLRDRAVLPGMGVVYNDPPAQTQVFTRVE